jgi:hypothetical protein
MKDEALKLALEALEEYSYQEGLTRAADQAITAIKQALAAPVQEPVAWMEMVVANLVREGVNKHKARELAEHFYTAPPAAQRQWVGLKNNELQPIADEYRILFGGWVEDFARAIEAKLKEKNT